MLPHVTPEAYRERAEQLRQHKIQTTNWLIETFFKRATFENFVSMIEQLPPGISELVTHPGYVDEPLRNLDTDYIEGRETELEILTHPLVKAVLDEYNVVLVDFSMLRTAKK